MERKEGRENRLRHKARGERRFGEGIWVSVPCKNLLLLFCLSFSLYFFFLHCTLTT
ncbi:hypothetical protein Hanom_Chr16g01518141 [Helianthus anomalus]